MSTENKVKIGISVDPDLLRRVDAVCAAKGEPRSNVFERAIREIIESEEKFVQDMESPFVRGVAKALVAHPKMLELLAKMAGEDASQERIASIVENLPKQLERGKERAESKRRGKAPGVAPA